MRKRFLSALLVSAMLATTLLAGCGDKKQETTPSTAPVTSNTPATTPTSEPAKGETLPEAKYYFSFDKSAGTTGIHAAQKGNGTVDIIEKDITFIPGVKGDAVYLDGVSGLKLDVNGVGDTYTVSYWMYATRFANYMPTLQFGPDVHGDATGNEHYLNLTRTEWNPNGASFPCVWSYDKADNGLWPNWYNADDASEHLKEWLNITLVVDASKLSEDGNCIAADLYVNGVLFGEGISVVNGTMAASDNFDFLVGVNYWDATFKGAFDEIYVFDKALTPGQVTTLFQAGDASVKYQEPERIIEVKPEEGALETLGTVDYKAEFGKALSQGIELKDGQTKKITLHNWSDGKDSKNNYAMLFTVGASTNPAADAFATVYADASGKGAAEAESCYTYNWGNWKTWTQSAMVDAKVTVKIERKGNEIIVTADNVDWNSTSNLMTATFKTTAADTDAVVVYFTAQNAYVDITSIKDISVSAGKVVGTLTQPFWSAFSDIWAVPAGTTRTINFTNFTAGDNNWENFVIILQNTPTGHSSDPALPTYAEGYAEYAVMRADNYGWKGGLNTGGNLAELGWEVSCDWNWETFKSDMDGAKVALTVTNNGTTADVVAVITTADGKTYTQSYKNIAVDGDLYVTLTLEKCYLVFEPTTVGTLTQPFWSAFSDIWAVPANGSTTVKFKNYTAGDNNWENFVMILQNTPTGHSSDPALPTYAEGYAEYAVMRADNYGWKGGLNTGGNLAELGWEVSCDWNWETFKADMDGADVEVTVTSKGATADVVAVVTTADGKTYTQSYKNIAVDGPLYLTFTLEKCTLIFE